MGSTHVPGEQEAGPEAPAGVAVRGNVADKTVKTAGEGSRIGPLTLSERTTGLEPATLTLAR